MTDYGKDITATDSIKTGKYSTGVRLVAEACYRRLITRRGELLGGEEEAEYGLHVADYLGAHGDVAKVEGLIKQELMKDQRIETAAVTITETDLQGTEKHWTINADCQTGQGPFELVLSVSGVTIELVGIKT